MKPSLRLSLVPGVHRATHRIGLWLDAAQVGAGKEGIIFDGGDARGHVLRRPHPQDRRSFLISLTPAGSASAARVHRRLAALEAAALRGLGSREVHALRSALQALQDATEPAIGPSPKKGGALR